MSQPAILTFALTVVLVFSTGLAYAAKDLANSATTEPMIVSYLKLDNFDAHYNYRYQLIERALELTRTEFGNYQLNLLCASTGTPIANTIIFCLKSPYNADQGECVLPAINSVNP